MKVVLSVDSAKFQLIGIGRYTYELAKGLQRDSLTSLQFLRGYRVSTNLSESDESRLMTGQPVWKQYGFWFSTLGIFSIHLRFLLL